MNVYSNLLEYNFSQTLFQLGIKKSSRIIIGVSGGPDSLALAGLYSSWAKDTQSNCYAIIIDHGLRVNSAEEAVLAQVELDKLHLNSKIIKIDKTPPSGNIQHWARIQRYELLTLEARLFRGSLMLAHHRDDQIETLYMRLGHSSGLIGLTGMKQKRLYHSVKIIRPLLEQKKADLTAYCLNKNIQTIEDPSNSIAKFDRVRARMHLQTDKKLSSQLIQLSQHTEKIVNVFKKHCSFWCSENIQIKLPIFASVPFLKFIGLPEIMRTHIFRQLLWQIGARDYPASNYSIKIGTSKIAARKKFTLAGCIIIVTKENIEIHAERKRKVNNQMPIEPNIPTILDNRWLFKSNKPIFSSQMTDECYRNLNQNNHLNQSLKKWPYPARLCIPLSVDLDGRVIQPHIEMKQSDLCGSQNNNDIMLNKKVTLMPLKIVPFWNEN